MDEGIVAVVRRKQAVLVIRRGADVPFAGYWAPVSGKIETGERPQETVTREVHEELGIAVRPLAEVWECPSSDGRYRLHWWLAEPVDRDAALKLNPREVDEARWLGPTEFCRLEKIFETDRFFFEEIFPALSD